MVEPPQCRAYPREHLVHTEGFGEVVVGSGIQGVHLVVLGVARRQDDDRDLGSAAQPVDHLIAVHVG